MLQSTWLTPANKLVTAKALGRPAQDCRDKLAALKRMILCTKETSVQIEGAQDALTRLLKKREEIVRIDPDSVPKITVTQRATMTFHGVEGYLPLQRS